MDPKPMSTAFRWFARFRSLAWAFGLLVAPGVVGAEPDPKDLPPDGPELAAELRSRAPDPEVQVTATLSVREPGKLRRLHPVQIVNKQTATGWTVRYEVFGAGADEKRILEILEVDASANVSPSYRWQRREGDSLRDVPTPGAEQRLGDSDFSFADLGLEFLFWPKQKITGRETRRTRECLVLESKPERTGQGYARVVSWIDIKTRQMIRAEAFDAAGTKVKMFKPDEFVYAKGHWQVKQLAIESPQRGTESYLLFKTR